MRNIAVLCISSMLFVANFAEASPHKVWVSGSDSDTSPVVSALKARLNGTERFQTIEHNNGDLTIAVVCFGLETYRVNGAICSYTFYYNPPSAPLLSVPIGTGAGILSANDRGTIGELIFQKFVDGTTEKSIQDAENALRASVSVFCGMAENAQSCKQK